MSAVALAALVWAVAQLAPAHHELSSLFPDNALLYLESRDFHALLNDWNKSEEKRTWIKGDNYEAFSRSRLFDRLSKAQDEFSAAASTSTDELLLTSVAGTQSALALYDIGNLEFVYVTRLNQGQAESTPLWQVRDRFELRTEGAAQFYVRQDQQSNRTAAFAVRDGWLILGTRADLVAGVLDRIQGASTHNLSDESWYADALKQASGSDQDLRMVLNLEKIVPSPYFRSYWVQRNITEMKQYRAAICDLHRSAQSYREDRVLLRKAGVSGAASGDARPLLAMAPAGTVFASAQASPETEKVLAEMRENLLDFKPAQMPQTGPAPAAAVVENAGDASMLEERIDVAPDIVQQADPYQPLRALLVAAQPTGMLEAYQTRLQADDMFVGIDRAIVLQSASPWNEAALKAALAAALRPGLTASQLGIGWAEHSSDSGQHATLDGQISLSFAIRENRLFLATSEPQLEALLASQKGGSAGNPTGITYAAVFHNSSHEQQTYRNIVNRLDAVGHGGSPHGASSDEAGGTNGQAPPFFSRNIASLSRMFQHVAQESIEERDEGAQVKQRIVYEWQHP
jgi:hypothetical protein